MIISVHVPKCAGTSFKTVLRGVFGDRMWDNYGTIFTREQARVGLVPEGTECIHGHFFADAFESLYPESPMVTFVRHPVERLVSHYHYFLRNPDRPDGCCKILHERGLSLREFADLDWMRNQTTRYFRGRGLGDFAFVGIAEQFEESLFRFEEALGCQVRQPVPHENVNPERTTPYYGLTVADYGYILERNQSDLLLYEQALQRHRQEIAAATAQVA
jgi:hypothetical protein